MSPVRAAAFDPAREQAALQIQRARRIHPRWAADGWRCFSAAKPEEAIDPQPYPDPVEALEAAEAALSAAEARDANRRAGILLGHLEVGTFFTRPVPDPQGGLAWQIRRAADGSLVETRAGLVGALVRIGELNSPPPAAPAPEL